MKINWKKLRACSASDQFTILLDLLMLWLIIVNLLFIAFDALFAAKSFQHWLGHFFPVFTDFYRDVIHEDFLLFDLVFVSVFLVEFFGRWLSSILRRVHQRWFFYPLIHWYDLFGCIPVPVFRWLRLLRVIDIARKLQQLGVLDVKQSGFFRVVLKIMDVIVEEISDRVVSNVLSGIQEELKHDSPVMHKISDQVIRPRQSLVVDWLTTRLTVIATSLYHPRRHNIQRYVKEIVSDALKAEGSSEHLKWIPLLGDSMQKVVESTISEVVFQVIDQTFDDLTSLDRRYLMHEVCSLVVAELLKPHPDLNSEARAVMVDAIELVKEQVAVKRWQQEFL